MPYLHGLTTAELEEVKRILAHQREYISPKIDEQYVRDVENDWPSSYSSRSRAEDVLIWKGLAQRFDQTMFWYTPARGKFCGWCSSMSMEQIQLTALGEYLLSGVA